MDKSFSTIEISEKKIDVNERSITHYISRKSIDRGGDIVLPNSLDDTNYRKNPIVLFNHNTDKPIGKSLWRKSDEEGILSKTQFGTTPRADDIYQLNKESILNGWSIGFIPRKWEYDQEKKITTFTLIELLEYSSVSIPMNQDAVTEGLKMVKSQYVKDVLTQQKQEAEFKLKIESFEKEIGEMKKLLDERSEILGKEILDSLEKVEKRIIEIDNEINKLNKKIAVGTLDKDSFVNKMTKKIVGDVS